MAMQTKMDLKLFIASIGLIIVLSSGLCGQGVSVKSWKSFKTEIQEQTFSFVLDRDNYSFERRLKDIDSKPILKLTVGPGWAGNPRSVIEYRIGLFTLMDPETNLLKPSNDELQDSFTAEDYPGWFLLGSEDQTIDRNLVFPVRETRTVEFGAFSIQMSIERFERDPRNSAAFEKARFRIAIRNNR